ncbi:MFS transporter [Nostoc sp. NMS4]|uniref:MFS transporter n=1 Tax=Nostoc sp. NMS4 TaxID=2815390 RepID=UPI0025E625B8|nr:MFS transporter [Nostoc sp. NMS4]MBN3925477.1 MFS transporter [Nostoc sp. NMS4]
MRAFQLQKTYKTKIGVAIAFYAFLVMGISNNVIGVLLPSLQATYNLTPASLTTLFLSQIGGAIFAGLTSSLLSKRIGFARMLLLASIMLTSALVIYAYSNHWFVMVASAALLGIGGGLIDSGINIYITNQQRSSNLIVFLHAFYGIGALLGSAAATTLLAIGLNWRFVYLQTAGLVGLMVVAMIWVIVYNYKPMSLYMTASGTNAKANLRLALNTPTVLVCGLLSFIYVGTEISIGNWAYSVQSISRNTPELLAGYSVSAYWLGITVGRLGMGSLMKRWGAVRAIDFSFVLLMSGLVIWWLLPNQLWSLPLIGFALAVIYPATIGLLPQRISETLVPSAISFMTSASYLGVATTLTVVNSLAEYSGLESIPILMVFMGALMVVLNRWLVKYAIAKKH